MEQVLRTKLVSPGLMGSGAVVFGLELAGCKNVGDCSMMLYAFTGSVGFSG